MKTFDRIAALCMLIIGVMFLWWDKMLLCIDTNYALGILYIVVSGCMISLNREEKKK